VEADSDGGLPVEKAAGLLAMHCMVRGQTPEDYEMMVVTRESLLHAVAERAQQLLMAGRTIGAGIRISPREQEVLDGILQNLANKVIASNLNVSERTVKFHVSSLLAKFRVPDRVALGREAAMYGMSRSSAAARASLPSLFPFPAITREAAVENADRPASAQPSADAPCEVKQDISLTRGCVFSIFRRERFAT
jgi:DNA-binding CsgD family transcriptional regulator